MFYVISLVLLATVLVVGAFGLFGGPPSHLARPLAGAQGSSGAVPDGSGVAPIGTAGRRPVAGASLAPHRRPAVPATPGVDQPRVRVVPAAPRSPAAGTSGTGRPPADRRRSVPASPPSASETTPGGTAAAVRDGGDGAVAGHSGVPAGGRRSVPAAPADPAPGGAHRARRAVTVRASGTGSAGAGGSRRARQWDGDEDDAAGADSGPDPDAVTLARARVDPGGHLGRRR